jgi:hypothetical protein
MIVLIIQISALIFEKLRIQETKSCGSPWMQMRIRNNGSITSQKTPPPHPNKGKEKKENEYLRD